jgi:hypothetical protein
MKSQTAILLDFSEEVQEVLQQQRINLFQIIQEEFPEIQLSAISDPQAHQGEKSLIEVIFTATPAIILAITPTVIRILNQFKPDETEIHTEVTETHHPNGTVTIHRITVSIQRQYNQQAPVTSPSQQPSLPSSQNQGN